MAVAVQYEQPVAIAAGRLAAFADLQIDAGMPQRPAAAIAGDAVFGHMDDLGGRGGRGLGAGCGLGHRLTELGLAHSVRTMLRAPFDRKPRFV